MFLFRSSGAIRRNPASRLEGKSEKVKRTEATDDPKRNGRPAKRAHGEKTIVFPEASDVFPGATGNPGDPRVRLSFITFRASGSERSYAVAAGCGVWGGRTCDGRAL